MKFIKRYRCGKSGFVLIGMIFTMLMMSVMALSMNRSAGIQTKIAANRTRSIQIHFGQLAVMEKARWELQQNSSWRVSSFQNYDYNGITYKRKAIDCEVLGFLDAVTVSVTAPGVANPMTVHFKWQLVDRSDLVSTLYIADYENHCIRKVDQETGIITTVAGTPETAGDLGDDGPATSAQLDNPAGVFVDGSGNIYIADKNNNRIRKVDGGTGIITTVAGNGSVGNGEHGLDPPQLATDVPLGSPVSVFVDSSGDLYFSDYNYHRIRKVDGVTKYITTVAGSATESDENGGEYSGDNGPATSAELYWPNGIDVDASGNIYIADSENHCIRKVDAASGKISTVAGNNPAGAGDSGDGGPAISAQLNTPAGVFVDASGNIYIADYENHRIKKVDAASGKISNVAGNGLEGWNGDGQSISRKLNNPNSVFVNVDGDFYISDKDNHLIRKVDGGTKIMTTVAGTDTGYSGDGGPATSAEINAPNDVFERAVYKYAPPQYGWAAVSELY
jgi:sugar lactone lactonase YvrE